MNLLPAATAFGPVIGILSGLLIFAGLNWDEIARLSNKVIPMLGLPTIKTARVATSGYGSYGGEFNLEKDPETLAYKLIEARLEDLKDGNIGFSSDGNSVYTESYWSSSVYQEFVRRIEGNHDYGHDNLGYLLQENGPMSLNNIDRNALMSYLRTYAGRVAGQMKASSGSYEFGKILDNAGLSEAGLQGLNQTGQLLLIADSTLEAAAKKLTEIARSGRDAEVKELGLENDAWFANLLLDKLSAFKDSGVKEDDINNDIWLYYWVAVTFAPTKEEPLIKEVFTECLEFIGPAKDLQKAAVKIAKFVEGNRFLKMHTGYKEGTAPRGPIMKRGLRIY